MNGKFIAALLAPCLALPVGLAGPCPAAQKKTVQEFTINLSSPTTVGSHVYMSAGELMGGWYNSDQGITTKLTRAVEGGEVRSYLMISGVSGVGKWNYAGSPRFALVPDRKYRLSGWMLVDRIDDPAWPPYLKCALFQGEKWLKNVTTRKYDLARTGEWQHLSVEFSVPKGEWNYKGNIALEKGTKDIALEVIVELSDLVIELVE